MFGFKVVRQRDAMQCGVACLNMVANHFGASLRLTDLEKLCTPTLEGVS